MHDTLATRDRQLARSHVILKFRLRTIGYSIGESFTQGLFGMTAGLTPRLFSHRCQLIVNGPETFDVAL